MISRKPQAAGSGKERKRPVDAFGIVGAACAIRFPGTCGLRPGPEAG